MAIQLISARIFGFCSGVFRIFCDVAVDYHSWKPEMFIDFLGAAK